MNQWRSHGRGRWCRMYLADLSAEGVEVTEVRGHVAKDEVGLELVNIVAHGGASGGGDLGSTG